MDLTILQTQAYDIARASGFYDPLDHPLPDEVRRLQIVQHLSMIASEVSEAINEIRDGANPRTVTYDVNLKPEGLPVELADIVLRTFSLAADLGIDLPTVIVDKIDYNRSRPRLHGRMF